MLPSRSIPKAWLCERFCGGVLTEERLLSIAKAKWESEQPIRDAKAAERKAEWKKSVAELSWSYRSVKVRTLWSVEDRGG